LIVGKSRQKHEANDDDGAPQRRKKTHS
jgi:hypothetical protein